MSHRRLLKWCAAAAVAAMLLAGLAACTPEEGNTPVVREVATVDEFLKLNDYTGEQYAGSTFNLVADLDFTATAFVPIGTLERPFSGTLNGNNHKIVGITLGEEEEDATLFEMTGLFGTVKDAVLKDFTVELQVSKKTGSKGTYLGGAVGAAIGKLTVENVTAKLEVSTKYETYEIHSSLTDDTELKTDAVEYLGGIAGYVNGQYEIKNAKTQVTVNETYVAENSVGQDLPREAIFAGGTVGYGKGKGLIENCDAELWGFSVSAKTVYAGGIAGYLNGASIKESSARFTTGYSTFYAVGANGKGAAGGVVGYAYRSVLEGVRFEASEPEANAPANLLKIRIRCDHIGKESFQFGGIAGYLENSDLKGSETTFSAEILSGISFGGIAGTMRGGSADGSSAAGAGFRFGYDKFGTYLENDTMQIAALIGTVKGNAVVKNLSADIAANAMFGKLVAERDVVKDENGNFVDGAERVPVVTENNRCEETKLIVG